MKTNQVIKASAVATVLVLAATSAYAVDPAARCEASKLRETAKYGRCRLSTDRKAIKTGVATDYAVCDTRFITQYTGAEVQAGSGVCPTEDDAARVADDVATCVLAISLALVGTGESSVVGEKCHAAKQGAASKAFNCRLDAESRHEKTGRILDVSDCEARLAVGFGKAEAKAGVGVCPTESDSTSVWDAIGSCGGAIAAYLSGIPSTTTTTLPPDSGTDSNIVRNGSFEADPPVNEINSDPSVQIPPGPAITGWTVTAGSVDLIGEPRWQASDGTNAVDLSGDTAGELTQVISTVPNETYRLTFAYGGNHEGSPQIKSLDVYWDDQLLKSLTFDVSNTSASKMHYKYFARVVTATASTSTLRFVSTTESMCGAIIDGVVLTHGEFPGAYDWKEWPVSEGGNGHRYALTKESRTWYECRDEAIAAGGHLVTINDAAENAWLYQQFATPGQFGGALWIGFNDIATEGYWEWVGGDGGWWENGNPASTSYVNWHPGTPEPNGGVYENAAVIAYADFDGDGRTGSSWTDAGEDRTDFFNGGIIEIDVP